MYIDEDTNTEGVFKLPKSGPNSYLSEVVVEIRNLWKDRDVLGFNVEVKKTKF
jgi:hypothetical protein